MPRRQLVSRSRVNQDSSPAPAARVRQRDAEPVALPPYEPPSCPLNAEARRALDNLRNNHDYDKYKTFIKTAIQNTTDSAADINERLSERQHLVQRAEAKRREAGAKDDEKTEEEIQFEAYARAMEKKVGMLTAKAEKALRDLIDYGDELAMQDTHLQRVSQEIAEAPVPQLRAAKRQRVRNDDEDDADEGEDRNRRDAEDTPAEDVRAASAIELLRAAKQEYASSYEAKTMREKYLVNDYRQFKRTIHDAKHPGDDAPPLPHERNWFPEDNADQASSTSARRRRNNMTDNTSNADDSDDDIIIQRSKTSYTCPIGLGPLREPFTSSTCNHTFEKENILGLIERDGTMYNGTRVKIMKCPLPGCDQMLKPSDLYDDQTILRKIQRAKRENREDDEDDDEDDVGTRSNKATAIDEDSDGFDLDPDNSQQHKSARIKQERQSGRLSMGAQRSMTLAEDEDEEMEDV